MIHITENIFLNENELKFDFIRASGPGGQNVNKVSTAVQLRFNVINSNSFDENIKENILKKEKNRISRDGTLIIEAKRFRTQEKNRADAINRLINIIKRASQKQKKRIKTNPSEKAKEKRLNEKKKRSDIKKLRKINPNTDL